MSPSTTLNIWLTADHKQWRVTCPFHHAIPLIMRDPDHAVLEAAMSEHIRVEHSWDVTSSRKPEDVSAPPLLKGEEQ